MVYLHQDSCPLACNVAATSEHRVKHAHIACDPTSIAPISTVCRVLINAITMASLTESHCPGAHIADTAVAEGRVAHASTEPDTPATRALHSHIGKGDAIGEFEVDGSRGLPYTGARASEHSEHVHKWIVAVIGNGVMA